MKGIHLVLIYIFLACNSTNKYFDINDYFTKKTEIKGEIIILLDSLVCNPTSLIHNNERLVIRDVRNKKYLTIIDTKDYKIIKEFGNIGKGPNEIIMPFTHFNITDNIIGVFDPYMHKLVRLNIDSIISNDDYNRFEIINFDNFNQTHKLISLKNIGFVGTGLYKDGRYGIFDHHGKSLAVLYEYPEDKHHEKTDNLTKGMAYQANVYAKPDNSKFVSVSSTLIIEIFTTDKFKIKKQKYLHLELPIYTNTSQGSSISAAKDRYSKIGAVDCTVSKNHFFILYSEKNYDSSGMNMNLTNKILVFDWNGKPVDLLTTDHELRLITFDTKNKILYGLSENPYPFFIKYYLANY
jgi:hypothetical protein